MHEILSDIDVNSNGLVELDEYLQVRGIILKYIHCSIVTHSFPPRSIVFPLPLLTNAR